MVSHDHTPQNQATRRGRLSRQPRTGRRLAQQVIASGGDLDAIKQAVGVVAKALERAGLAETRITARPSERMQGHHPGH